MTGMVTCTSATHDAECREHELHRLRDQAEFQQHRIDEAVVAQHDDPGIGAHHFAKEERRDDGDQHEGFGEPVANMHQRISQRIADDQSEHRRQKADPDGVDEDVSIKRLEQRREICKRKAARLQRAGNESADAILQHRRHRGQKAERAERRGSYEAAKERLRLHNVAGAAARSSMRGRCHVSS